MFRRGVLLMPRRRYHPPYGLLCHLPLREISVGTGHLFSWNGDSPRTGISVTRAVLSEETEPVPPVSPKCLKVRANDASGAGQSTALVSISEVTDYLGLTLTAKSWGYAPSTNLLTSEMRLIISGTGGVGDIITKDDSWHFLTAVKKLTDSETLIQLFLRAKTTSDANTTDVAYFDDVSLTVPQSITPNGLICHPEGCSRTPEGFSFDGVDDLLTFGSDFIGTSACTVMGWIKPTGLHTGSVDRIIDNGKFIITVSSDFSGVLRFTSDGGVNVAISANGSITLNQWQHVAVTRLADGKATFYINGVLSGTPNQDSGTPTAGTTNCVVGNRLASDRPYKGLMDDLLAFKRALAEQEIQAHYEATKGYHG